MEFDELKAQLGSILGWASAGIVALLVLCAFLLDLAPLLDNLRLDRQIAREHRRRGLRVAGDGAGSGRKDRAED